MTTLGAQRASPELTTSETMTIQVEVVPPGDSNQRTAMYQRVQLWKVKAGIPSRSYGLREIVRLKCPLVLNQNQEIP